MHLDFRQPISQRLTSSVMALQYAYDTALIINAGTETIITVKLILRVFAKISGLEINYQKSCFVPINLDHEQLQRAVCQCSEFPVTYLGMSLTIIR